MNDQIKREEGVHGERWHAVHEGYFSDPAVAAPLVETTRQLALKSTPQVIVDLGGGTGFLLSRIREAGVDPAPTFVNLDNSSVQLDAAVHPGITPVRGSVDVFLRQDLGRPDDRFLYLMRSVLHYFGKEGLRPVLRHLRKQVKPGEYFVHQTAAFIRPEDAACLNQLYRMMRSPKWFPTTNELDNSLRAEGWDVLEAHPALPLRLKDDELRQRYRLDQADIGKIRDRLSCCPMVSEDVFRQSASGFSVLLHYQIYVCTPSFQAKSSF